MTQDQSVDRVIKNGPKFSALRNADDLLVRVTAGLAFAIYAGYCLDIGFVRLQSVDLASIQPHQIGRVLAVFSVAIYNMIIAVLYGLRLRPVSKSLGIIPGITALVGGFMLSSLLLLNPRENLPLGVLAVADFLIVIGNILIAFVLLQLGRSFSILPEGRRLVTHGIYSVVRHPLYLAEAVAALGLAMTYWSPLSWLLVAAWFGVQIARTYNEERVLREYFPEYVDYARKTPRMIPGVY